MATPNYEIEDKKTFADVEAEQAATLNEIGRNYDNAINTYQEQIDKQSAAMDAWATEQKRIQQAQNDFAIQKINQQKEQASQDYTKEQSAAYADWQKQSNQYGVNAEQMAEQGMTNSGYSESSQVSMYTAYQNRVATARASYDRTILNFNNAITEATLQNNAALAQIAYNALQSQLTLTIEGLQYKNNLIIEKSNQKLAAKQVYHNQYLDVLDQINKENSLAEEVRQYNETLAEEKRQFDATHGGAVIGDALDVDDGTTTTPATETGDASTGTDISVDIGSVDALGFPNLTNNQLEKYIADKYVERYEEGGKVKYRLTEKGREYQYKLLPRDTESILKLKIPNIDDSTESARMLDAYVRMGFVDWSVVNGKIKYRLTQRGKEEFGVISDNEKNLLDMLQRQSDDEFGPTVETKIDRESIKALGFDDMSDKQLERLVSWGYVEKYRDGEYIRYMLTPKGQEYLNNKKGNSR